MAPKIYCIDGNIGVGKSTLLEELRSRGYKIFTEDLAEWEWCLANYYVDGVRWAFTLQMAILSSMWRQFEQVQESNEDVVFVERSPKSNLVFIENAMANGLLSQQEFDLFKRYHSLYGWAPYRIVKLVAPVDVCLDRVHTRGRSCESGIDKGYLQALDVLYDKVTGDDVVNVDVSKTSISNLADYVEQLVKTSR